MSMVTVASLPLGDALLDARQVICCPLSMLDAAMWSVLTVLSLLPSRNSVCAKHNNSNRSRKTSDRVPLRNFSCFLKYTSKTGFGPCNQPLSAGSLWKQLDVYPATLETRARHRWALRRLATAVPKGSLYPHYKGIRSGEVAHFIHQTQSISFAVILPAPQRCDIQAFVEELCLFRKDY